MNKLNDALGSLARQLQERHSDDAETAITLTVERAMALFEAITAPQPQPKQEPNEESMGPASAEDMKVYAAIAAGYHKDTAPKQEPAATVTSTRVDPDGVVRSGLDRELPLMTPLYTAPQPQRDDTALLRQALEALEAAYGWQATTPMLDDAIAALRERLK